MMVEISATDFKRAMCCSQAKPYKYRCYSSTSKIANRLFHFTQNIAWLNSLQLIAPLSTGYCATYWCTHLIPRENSFMRIYTSLFRQIWISAFSIYEYD